MKWLIALALFTTTGLLTRSSLLTPDDTTERSSLKIGQQLYEANCTSCHSKDLKTYLTAPPLGDIQRYASKAWFIRCTQNINAMIREGDPLAVCSWEAHQPVIMNNFSELSEEEIGAIYAYIVNKSEADDLVIDRPYWNECRK